MVELVGVDEVIGIGRGHLVPCLLAGIPQCRERDHGGDRLCARDVFEQRHEGRHVGVTLVLGQLHALA